MPLAQWISWFGLIKRSLKKQEQCMDATNGKVSLSLGPEIYHSFTFFFLRGDFFSFPWFIRRRALSGPGKAHAFMRRRMSVKVMNFYGTVVLVCSLQS